MNKAQYTGYVPHNFPLSVQGLDFIQQQILLAAEYARSAGGNYLLSGCSLTGAYVSDGVLIINGEILPFKGGNRQDTIRVSEQKENVQAGSYVYRDAYTRRFAEFGTNTNNKDTYNWDSFVAFPTNRFLLENSATKQELQELQNLAMPKGAIIMWSGAVSAIPAGYVLCDGRPAVNGVTVPDLRGRFIVGYYQKRENEQQANNDLQGDYGSIGNPGGKKEVTLSENQMPSHNHTTDPRFNKLSARASDIKNKGSMPEAGDDGNDGNEYQLGSMGELWSAATIKTVGGNQPHENRPPYYTLAFIIKTV